MHVHQYLCLFLQLCIVCFDYVYLADSWMCFEPCWNVLDYVQIFWNKCRCSGLSADVLGLVQMFWTFCRCFWPCVILQMYCGCGMLESETGVQYCFQSCALSFKKQSKICLPTLYILLHTPYRFLSGPGSSFKCLENSIQHICVICWQTLFDWPTHLCSLLTNPIWQMTNTLVSVTECFAKAFLCFIQILKS